ncbi:hypothetical protein B0H13DRAFT_2676146 [Mycena leptocephala]|nr:hypothetical protein B0H13DRAFT_2676146 [Mycena leptocephala]
MYHPVASAPSPLRAHRHTSRLQSLYAHLQFPAPRHTHGTLPEHFHSRPTGTRQHQGRAHPRPPLPRRMDPLPSPRQDIHGAHSLSRQHPAQELSPHLGKPERAGSSAHPHIHRTCIRRRRGGRTYPSESIGRALIGRLTDSAFGMRESRKKEKSEYWEEEEERWKKGRKGHTRTQRATGEKGSLERATRGMCVSKIVTETREEKEEKALRARWEDGRKKGEEGSTNLRRSLLQRWEELAGARAQEETAPANLSTGGGNINEERASTRLRTFLVLVPPSITSSSAMPCCPIPA